MPIYEYECSECGNITEALQKFSDSPLTTCERCSGSLHRIMSQSTFHLKGSGWYVTDYANKSKTNSSAENNKSEKPADTSPPKSTESKTESKSPE